MNLKQEATFQAAKEEKKTNNAASLKGLNIAVILTLNKMLLIKAHYT